MYIFTVYALCAHLNDLWTNTCGLVSKDGTCFWDHACANEVWKVWGGQSVHTTLKEFRGCECGFTLHRTRGYSSFSRQPRTLFATHSSFSTRTSRRCDCIYAVYLPFRFHARLLALSFSLPSPFCCCNNETASAATVLRTINLRKCTQLFVNEVF